MTFDQLTSGQRDALKEISNIGMGHAADALSRLLRETIMLKVPRVSVTDLSQVPEVLGGSERVVAGVSLRMHGDAQGSILLVFPCVSALQLLEGLLGPREAADSLDALAVSALKEVGNILASAYLSALGGMLGLSLLPSVPALACDMAGAVVDHILIDLGREGDAALMLETEFHSLKNEGRLLKGHFFLLPDPDSLEILLRSLGEVS
ncbi:CheC, inhibitor of MCP methylation [Geoalkalibacter ferrihydriticus]|uniref:Chemotaxis protein CheY n=2 Tax=Geoalkalibacter ferrihydriticus TaxID=392333 RepID=A0A0C2HSK2_9BACT|nr:chemotaxis protein CheC [Geoalkalibacter ferrihydriticus]KIH77790.1 chemotaxis protein CheY [Geoalkalibacter ferrihydriticus DSM 17813]SDL79387.1 CheC, inhibitor of MCP methylation [Geoalkalibacter ferrihydriticus]